jgi:hypothetical protein
MTSNFFFWLLVAGILALACRTAIWLYALDQALKNQARMRCDLRLGDVSQLAALTDGRLDLQDLEPLTGQLRQLGFTALGDILSEMSYDPLPDSGASPIVDPFKEMNAGQRVTTKTTGMARLFVHPVHRCYASLISVMAVSRFDPALGKEDHVKIAPFRTVVLSMGDADEGWCFANHNREVDPFSLLIRHPRKPSHRMIGATPEQLLQAHLTEREDIARRGNFQWDKTPSMEKYLAFENKSLQYIRGVYEKANFLSVALFLHTYRFKKQEWWMGELDS